MSIEAINEQLLRAIGVGVALLNLDDFSFMFLNDTFAEWFGEPEANARIGDLFPGLEIDAMKKGLVESARYTTETSFKLRRRTMSVAMDFSRTSDAGRAIAVLVCQNITRIKELESMIDSYSMMVERNTRELKREKEQVEKLLLNMMPRSVYEEYKTFGVVTPRLYGPVSVMTIDFADFDRLAATLEPAVVASELGDIFGAFDLIGEQFGCERIKGIGDIHFSVAGVPDPSDNHVLAIASTAVRVLRYLAQRNESHPNKWQARIACATGTVIGSVVSARRHVYDVFGPAVSTARRLRNEFGEPMTILADANFAAGLDDRFVATPAHGKAFRITERQAAGGGGHG